MCGICGIVDFGKGHKADRETVVRRVSDEMAHRGPDGSGLWSDESVSLGHRRLAIIDLEGGAQPMTNEDGSIVIVFNGEIYNFQELFEELQHRHDFRTRSDTEAIIHLYEEMGPNCLQRLRGMFGFAIWDSNKRTLFVARDRFGKKPLYFVRRSEKFCFASELVPLLSIPGVSCQPDLSIIPEFLARGYVSSPKTGFTDIWKLKPAHYLLVSEGDVSERRYWHPPLGLAEFKSIETAEEELEAALDEAVRLRMISDVPLGAFLSGGVDSSLIVGLMAKHSTAAVKTFSIGFEQQSWNELPHARTVAKHIGAEHREFIVDPADISLLPLVIDSYGEPHADPISIANLLLARETRNHVTVALNGDGGDELFVGYPRYLAFPLLSTYSRLPKLVRKVAKRVCCMLPEGTGKRDRFYRIRKCAIAGSHESHSMYSDLHCFLNHEDRQSLLGMRCVHGVSSDGEDSIAGVFADLNGACDPVRRLQICDQLTYLPELLLSRGDRMCMQASLEARSPLLDHKLAEVAARIPSTMHMKGKELKHLLKRIAVRYLPRQVVHRPKHGFQVPTGDWFHGSLRPLGYKMVRDSMLVKNCIVDGPAMASLWNRHVTQRQNCGDRLWNVLMLEVWFRRFFGGGVPEDWMQVEGRKGREVVRVPSGTVCEPSRVRVSGCS